MIKLSAMPISSASSRGLATTGSNGRIAIVCREVGMLTSRPVPGARPRRRPRTKAIAAAPINSHRRRGDVSTVRLGSARGSAPRLTALTGATNLYPCPGIVTMKRCSPSFSPKARRSAEIF